MPKLTLTLLLSCSFVVASAADAATSSRGDCLSAVQTQQEDILRQHIDDQVNLATNTYPKKSQSFSDLSCLDNLMNSGMDIFFSPPGLGDLMSKLKSYACNAVDSQYSQLTSSISSGANSSLSIGEVVPGLNLGSIGGGFGTTPGSGTSFSNVSANANKVTNDFNSILGN